MADIVKKLVQRGISIASQVDLAWIVGTTSHCIWETGKDSPYGYIRRIATGSRARAIVNHDRVLNIEETMRRRDAK
ncbi:hypothetical protein [Halomonas sp. DP5N14-9]|uniref:Uncharacterized protein n=1 Tax=Halomonas sp. RT37 TaxID=2950872 RepID=A0AAU7KE68_9GAMM|nr:hypothetical protein [Halomonas sp. DP5N14-9]MBY5942791.1 hypothetical protein [Halomonas sp. DP5N14-9]